jgi:hypothetical protein
MIISIDMPNQTKIMGYTITEILIFFITFIVVRYILKNFNFILDYLITFFP